ncbi:MAG: deoxyribodipyrimidine photo-lyase/cryptochrome family protein [Cytophagales bacterium]
MKPPVKIVWFKRDLRLTDHQPLLRASEDSIPVLLLYFFEPSIMAAPDSDKRHWRFVQESLLDMNNALSKMNLQIQAIDGEVVASLEKLVSVFEVKKIFSHQETGNHISYQRDLAVAVFCQQHNIVWHEYPTNGVIRGLKTRKDFTARWLRTMTAPILSVDWTKLVTVSLPDNLLKPFDYRFTANSVFQPGGSSAANRYLQTFLNARHVNYQKHISKPEDSRKSCSRLSPYLAWGNVSMKEVYQATLHAMSQSSNKKSLRFFTHRLHWHCHFIQKFESECRMEFENLNRGFDEIRTEIDKKLVDAWENGQTGYPLIDACINCVKTTGYLNFRMRSLLVSFFTHHLWQPWQAGAHFLARQFLDFEPGIHYPQFQMQAGTMGVNTIRIYNPVKQSIDHDPEGNFIRKWLPVLQRIPNTHIHEPWRMTSEEQALAGVIIGIDYPQPIVVIAETARFAREHLWRTKNSVAVQSENKRILKKHTKRKTEKENTLRAPLPLGDTMPLNL